MMFPGAFIGQDPDLFVCPCISSDESVGMCIGQGHGLPIAKEEIQENEFSKIFSNFLKYKTPF